MSEPHSSLDAPDSFIEATRAQKAAWILYDWANSGYGLVWNSVFPAVFISAMLPAHPHWPTDTDAQGADKVATGLELAGQQVPGSAVYALLVAGVALITVLSAPVLGALADARGWQRQLFVSTVSAGSLVAMAAILIPSDSDSAWIWAAILFFVSFYLFGLSITFYNAYLPVIAGPTGENRLGGWGFAVGYIGGAVMLVIAGLVMPRLFGDTPRTFNVGLAASGLWWLLFSLPAFFLMPHVPPARDAATRPAGVFGPFVQVARTLKDLRQYRMLFLFLLAFLVYINGVESVIILSSAFASDVLKMTVQQLTIMYLIVQVVAFAGAATCGYVADYVGNKAVIITALLIWCVGVGLTYFVTTPTQFTMLGVLIGLVLGGVQSSSRTLMSKLTPAEFRNEAFGFYAIGTKAMSIFGPLLFAAVATLVGSQYAVFAVLPFLVGGILLLLPVREPPIAPPQGGRDSDVV